MDAVREPGEQYSASRYGARAGRRKRTNTKTVLGYSVSLSKENEMQIEVYTDTYVRLFSIVMIYMPRQLRPQRRQAIGLSVDPVPKTGLRGSEGQGVGDFPQEEPGFAADEEEVCDVRVLCGEEGGVGEGEGEEGEEELEWAMRWERRGRGWEGARQRRRWW